MLHIGRDSAICERRVLQAICPEPLLLEQLANLAKAMLCRARSSLTACFLLYVVFRCHDRL